MESFIVSARKYRPTRFEDVVGQQHITRTLKNAIKNNQVAQAFLFCGPRGVGKTTSARILAKTINCENITAGIEACGECASCVAFQQNASFNVHELDAASNNSVDDMRALIEQVRYMPQSGKYKIYIIDEVHMLSAQAFNAFLKTLEEPPHYAIFILATTEKHKILPTILSRCQIFDFNRITVNDIVEHLKDICKREDLEYEPDALHIIAQKADGALRDALSIFDRIVSFSDKKIELQQVLENLNILDYDHYFKIVDALLAQDAAGVLNMYDEILQKGFEGDIFLNGAAQHFRDVMVCKDEATLQLLDVSENLKERYREQAAYAPASFLLSALNIINAYEISYKGSKNKRLHVELALLKLCHITTVVAPSEDFIPAEVKKNTSTEQVKPHNEPQNSGRDREEKKTPSPVAPPEPVQEEHHTTSQKAVTKEKTESAETVTEEEKKQSPAKEISVKRIQQKNISSLSTGMKLGNYEDMKKNIPSAKIEEKAEEEEEKIASFENLDYTKELLLQAWGECVQAFQERNKMGLASVFQNYDPIVNGANQIEVIVDNLVDHDLVAGSRIEITDLLKQKLNSSHVQLVIEYDKTSKLSKRVSVPYTSREKFEKMKEKNPLLQNLKDILDLEIEF